MRPVKLRAFIMISLVSYGAFIGANYFSSRLSEPMSEEAIAGKQVWQKHDCVSCHTLFGNGGYVGADMTHIVAERGSKNVLNYLVRPPVMPPNLKQHHPGLSGPEATKIVQYFEYLDKIPTLGWPPQPHKAEMGS